MERKIFQPFITSNHKKGSGLGLPISKHLAQLLGGDISVKSTSNMGSAFTVTINRGDLSDVEVLHEQEPIKNEINEVAISINKKGNILLAEDNEDIQQLVKLILTQKGFNVTLANNGRKALLEAMQSIKEGQPFDLILMDMKMPELDGYEATRELRERGWSQPIIALTANAMPGDKEKCLESGCDGYLDKMVNRNEFISIISSYLQ